MNINIGRMKIWDWAAIAAFVVTIIGVAIPWWRLAESVNYFGRHSGAGKAIIVFSVFAVVWVLAKILLPADKPLPKWYMEAWPLLVFGAIIVICGLVGTADKPGGGELDFFGAMAGVDVWSWRPGALIALFGGIAMAVCGWMMFQDKSGDYGQSVMPNINVNTGGGSPPPSGPTSSGGTPPAAQ